MSNVEWRLISESDLFNYYGKFTFSDRQFNDKLADISSTLYTSMSAEVTDVVGMENVCVFVCVRACVRVCARVLYVTNIVPVEFGDNVSQSCVWVISSPDLISLVFVTCTFKRNLSMFLYRCP